MEHPNPQPNQQLDLTSRQEWWHSQTFIQFEMIRSLQGRMLSAKKLLKSKDDPKSKDILIRYLSGHTIDILRKNLSRFEILKQPHRLYYDLTTYPKQALPLFSFNLDERTLQKQAWDETADNLATGMDFAIDLDAKSLQDWRSAWKDARKIKTIFDQLKLPYYLGWSGNKGFHFNIAAEHIPKLTRKKEKPIFEICKRYCTTAKNMKRKLKLKTLDLAIYDSRRIFKLPYSMDGKSGLICYPLTDWQFNNFNPAMVEPETVLTKQIKGRGLLIREGTGEAVKQLFKRYEK